MTTSPTASRPLLTERRFLQVSWRQGSASGVWPLATFTQERLAVESEDLITPDAPVQLRLTLRGGETLLTEGTLSARLDEGPTPLMLFTLALRQADLKRIRASPPEPPAQHPDTRPRPDRLHILGLALLCVALGGLTLALVLLR